MQSIVSWDELNFFIVTPSVTATPLLYMNTFVHEATHAIQDRNKWRMSRLDNEVDAHFAEALYLFATSETKRMQKSI